MRRGATLQQCSRTLILQNCCSRHYHILRQITLEYPVHAISKRNIGYFEKIAAKGSFSDGYDSGFSEAGGLDNFGTTTEMEQFMIDYVPEFINTTVPKLQELAIDNCWPSTIIAHTFNNVQEITGLPWFVTIVVVSVVFKTSMYPFHVWWRKDFQDHVKSSPAQLSAFLQTYFNETLKLGAEDALRHAYAARAAKCTELNLPLLPSLFPLYVTTIVPIMTTLGLAHLTNLTYEPLLNGGLLWFQNLAEPDPFILLPALNSVLIIMNSRLHPLGLLLPKPVFIVGFKSQVAFVLLTCSQMWFSSALLLHWISANSVGVIIQLLLRRNAIRRYHQLENKIDLFKPLLSHSSEFRMIGENVDLQRKRLIEIKKEESKLNSEEMGKKLLS